MKVGTFQVHEPVPELRDPHMISILHPWIDAGSAGSVALRRLERRLNAQELAKLDDPGRYFDFTRYRPTSRLEDGQRRLTVPNTIINYARAEGYPDPEIVEIHVIQRSVTRQKSGLLLFS